MATFNPNSGGDGYIMEAAGDWATVRAATTGNQGADKTGASIRMFVGHSGTNWWCMRGFMPFDTSSLADDADILSATLTINVTGNAGSGDATDKSVYLVASTQASNTDLVAGDYDQAGATSFANTIDCSSTGTKVFTLNAAGLAAISKTGYTSFAIRTYNDFNNVAPSSGDTDNFDFYCDSATGTTPPVLTVTLPVIGTNGKKMTVNYKFF